MSFKDGTEGYVVKNYRDIKDVEGVGSYLARYVRHPPIGESRILGFDGERVRIKYEWDNEVHETTVTTERFIGAMLSNIPPKWFRVVRWFGLYSNTLRGWGMVQLMAVETSPTTLDRYVPTTPEVIVCSNCGGVMEPAVLEFVRNGRWEIIVY